MNYKLLRTIIDAKVDDYLLLGKEFKDNFIARLASFIKSALPRNKANQEAASTRTFHYNNNEGSLEYRPKGRSVSFVLDGVPIYSGTLGNGTLEQIVKATLDAELSRRIDIDRPKGRSLYNEKKELREKSLKEKGINLSSRFSKMIEALGEVSKSQGKIPNVLNEREFRYLSSKGRIEESDYEKVGTVYINKDCPKFTMKSDLYSPDDYGTLAREEGLVEFLEKYEFSPKEVYIESKNGDLYRYKKGDLMKIKK